MPDIITWCLLLCTVVCVQVVAFSVELESKFVVSDGKRLFSSAECSLLLYHCIETIPFTCVSASFTFPH